MKKGNPYYMTKEQINGSKVLAKFMGERIYGNAILAPSGWCRSFEYHYSWDWIMPVLEKIGDIGYYYSVGLHGCAEIHGNINDRPDLSVPLFLCDSSRKPITAAFRVAVRFVRWLNKQNKK